MEKEVEKIFEDEKILVISKPSGLVVNRSNTYKKVTLQDILEMDYPDIFDGIDDDQYISRSGVVHRLDKDTSGVVVVAKDPESFYFLQRQFKNRKTFKEYVFISHGIIQDEIIEIDAPLGRNPKNPLKRAVVSSGKSAFTKIEIERVSEIDSHTYTLGRAFPKTGRTHQIRVHLSAIGHSIVGDGIYCPKNLLEIGLETFGRMMLHAKILGIISPSDNKFHRFESPLPKEFKI